MSAPEETWDADWRGSRFPRPCSGCGLTLQNEADRARHLGAVAPANASSQGPKRSTA